ACGGLAVSFILDALRKSESERQQDSKPSIARIPSAVPQHGLPPWALATMAALGVGIVVLGGAWISTLTGESGSSAETARSGQATDADDVHAAREGIAPRSGSAERASPRVEPLELPPPATASLPDPVTAGPDRSTRASTPAAAGGSALADSARTSPLAAAAQPSPLAMAARNPPSTPRPSTATAANRPAPNRASLPDVQATEPYQAVAASLGLPELTLQLLAYDENDPSQQYAFINGVRYAAGDTLPGGAQVIA